jgi:hypothetical protein
MDVAVQVSPLIVGVGTPQERKKHFRVEQPPVRRRAWSWRRPR